MNWKGKRKRKTIKRSEERQVRHGGEWEGPNIQPQTGTKLAKLISLFLLIIFCPLTGCSINWMSLRRRPCVVKREGERNWMSNRIISTWVGNRRIRKGWSTTPSPNPPHTVKARQPGSQPDPRKIHNMTWAFWLVKKERYIGRKEGRKKGRRREWKIELNRKIRLSWLGAIRL